MSSFLSENSAWSLLDSAPYSNAALMKANGVVYTPEFLADFVAANVLSLHFSKYAQQCDGAPLRVLDPACGNGELLLAISRQHRLAPSNLDALSHLSLFGAELEETSALATRSRLEDAGHESCQIECTNALLPFNMDRNSGWRTLGKQWGVTDGFDIIIANPPWGADVSDYSHRLVNGGYFLNKGQFDTSDLFVELSLSLVKRGGFIAFIIPDSLFSDERKNLRRLLLHTNIKFVGRLGEKIFKGVNRGCAVIICEVTDKVDTKNDVTCLRLTPDSRRALLDKQTTLNEIEERDSHQVPQQRFLDNRQYRFDIDNRVGHDIRLQDVGLIFGTYLQSTRGVELSKSGKVCQCPRCNKWIPHPRSKNVSCLHCDSEIEVSRAKVLAIISKDACEDVLPIIVGENIQRYTLCGNLWLTPSIEGINYKSAEIYSGPKLLVRKTGVGISATIDYSNSFTNQVVYIFKLKASSVVLPLEFFLGVLNSRLIYYHTTIKHGETEWRSHPYVTQRQILDMPLPSEKQLLANLNLVKEIADLVRASIRSGRPIDRLADAKVERLVATLFGLTKNDYKTIYSTLNQLEGLLPVRQLQSVTINDIFE